MNKYDYLQKKKVKWSSFKRIIKREMTQDINLGGKKWMIIILYFLNFKTHIF